MNRARREARSRVHRQPGPARAVRTWADASAVELLLADCFSDLLGYAARVQERRAAWRCDHRHVAMLLTPAVDAALLAGEALGDIAAFCPDCGRALSLHLGYGLHGFGLYGAWRGHGQLEPLYVPGLAVGVSV